MNPKTHALARILPILFATLALGGCLGGGGQEGHFLAPVSGTDEPISTVVVEAEPGLQVAENRGALRGYVRSDANLSVSKAHLSLAGTDLFADTNQTGEFLFVNISAGVYTVFVQADGFEPSETQWTVRNGNVTIAFIFLLPKTETGAGYRPHIHDYWGDKTELTMMDQDVDFSAGQSSGNYAYEPYYARTYCANANCSDNGGNPKWRFTLPEGGDVPGLILPGTKEVEVTFSWTSSQSTLTKMGFLYKHAATTKFNFTPEHASGKPWTIQITPEMADTGHQRFTLWALAAYTANSASASTTTWQPNLVLGTVHVKVLVRKADVWVEPAHQDYWQGKDSMVVRNASVVDTRTQVVVTDGSRAYGGYSYRLPAGKLVPPGTNHVKIVFTWKYATAPGVGDQDYVLTWRTADQHPFYTPSSQYRRAAPTKTGDHTKTYEFDVKPEQTDAFYQRFSSWIFLPSPAGQENDPNLVDKNYGGISFTLEVTVSKDPAYK
jgi:hypothetical protein